MNKINEFLNYTFDFTDQVHISVKAMLVVALAFFITNNILKFSRKIINKRLEEGDKGKFKTVFTFLKYFIYVLVIIIALESSGIQVSVLLAGSAALLVGLGLGLQTLFQDIISGIFILLDKSLHVNDIVEIDDKVGKIFEINLRTTRAVTIDNRVLIIPNHVFLTHSLFNWTQNSVETTEVLTVGVAYGSDVEKVKQLLIQVATEHSRVLKNPKPDVLFMDFADSALIFRLVFSINNSFAHLKIKSDLRFAIDKKFREQKVQIPFPQRDIHLYNNSEK
ncbi:Mechanosensitive ion channel [Lutibacter agarilyticus]|uniref:Mechanosensitive ion channel n=1 Tax=Lutibacter agarilyticus TaxID=1109740 RepID=A0A238X0X2_9FLAO|nr:mechanosensitive ion channel domain-containing protein [Lutibacter agarilyticus]SNR52134.1 Mechanosensitive ion channel [Lutibacter agarilyticus]